MNTHPDYTGRTAEQLRAGPDSRLHLRRHAHVDQVGLERRSHVQGRRGLPAATPRCRRVRRPISPGVYDFLTERQLQRGGSENLSAALPDPHGPVRLRPDRSPGQRVRAGQVAGQQEAHPQPRRPIRLAGAGGNQGRDRAAFRRGLRSDRRAARPSSAAASERSSSISRSRSCRRSSNRRWSRRRSCTTRGR